MECYAETSQYFTEKNKYRYIIYIIYVIYIYNIYIYNQELTILSFFLLDNFCILFLSTAKQIEIISKIQNIMFAENYYI